MNIENVTEDKILANFLHKNCCQQVHSIDYCNFYLTNNWDEYYKSIWLKKATMMLKFADLKTITAIINLVKKQP